MKNCIDRTGIELEAKFETEPENFKSDGSLHFNGEESCDCDNNYDNCECSNYCECNDCQRCQGCDDSIDNCDCCDCLICSKCDNCFDDCLCCFVKLDTCKNVNCGIEICDQCIQENNDNREFTRNCNNGHGTYNNCSFECSCECSCESDCECSLVGETVSKPLKTKKEILGFMIKNYNLIEKINSSCGLHVHKSFKDDKKDINVLCSQKFHDYFKESMFNWAVNRKINRDSRFFKRLEGVEYCQNQFNGYNQLSKSTNDRYTMLNFNSYHKFKTLEVRLGTMFDDVKISIEYVNQVEKIINQYLDTNKPKVYELEIKLNKSTHIYLNMTMVKTGLKIFVKTHGIENLFKNKDIANYDKFKLYRSDIFRLNTNLTSLIDDEHNHPNLTFMRLVGSHNGKSMIIKNVFSDKAIDDYYAVLITAIPRIIREFKEIKTICV